MCFSIETEHLILRKFNEKDSNSFFKITRDYDIIQYVSAVFTDSPKETFELVKAYSNCDLIHDFYLAIEEKSSHKLIGGLLINENFRMDAFEVAYFIVNQYRRHGYMIEALQGFIDSNCLKNKTLSFQIKKNNIASLSVIKNLDGVVDNSILLKNGLSEYQLFHYYIE